MTMRLFKRFETRFGIDLGTSTTIIYQYGKGIVLNEPSVVALNRDNGQIEAVGEQARAMIGRTPEHLEIIYPLKDGVIANFDMTTAMLQYFIRKIGGRKPWFRNTCVYISVPCGITNVQKRAVEETAVHKGAKKAVAVEEPIAAAMGALLPVEEPTGSMILDIGGGTSQAAVLSMGGIVVSHSIRRGGMAIDSDIIEYVKKTYNLAIGQPTAEEIKIKIGQAVSPVKDLTFDAKGRDLISGLPKTVSISSREIYGLLEEFISAVVEAIRITLEKCPPELAGDVMERGVMLCGGGALLSGLARRLQEEILVPVHLADDPQACTALGTGRMIGYGLGASDDFRQWSKPETMTETDESVNSAS